jgi:hypothetical protein
MAATWRGRSPSAGSASRELDPEGTLVASGRVGLITHKDCKRALAEALGIPAHHTGHFWGMRESLQLQDCNILLVVGTPAVRPEQVARLARAYYHADLQVIDETCERGEDGAFRYRDPRMQRVANALVRAELTRVCPPQSAAALRRAGGGHPVHR